MRARTGAVGDIDRVREALERQRLVEEVLWIARHRWRDFRGDDEPARLELVLECLHVASSQSFEVIVTIRLPGTFQAMPARGTSASTSPWPAHRIGPHPLGVRPCWPARLTRRS